MVDGKYISQDNFHALRRLRDDVYLEDEWEDDPEDAVRKLYRMLLSDIDKPEGEALFEDKALILHSMIEDVRVWRQYHLGNLEYI